jgi:hypothetical protein
MNRRPDSFISALILGAAMLAIGADAFGVEHGALSFEQCV